jgi:hypothetical protein
VRKNARERNREEQRRLRCGVREYEDRLSEDLQSFVELVRTNADLDWKKWIGERVNAIHRRLFYTMRDLRGW